MKKTKKIYMTFGICMIALACSCIASLICLCFFGIDTSLLSAEKPKNSSYAKLAQTYDYGDGYIKKIVFLSDRTVSPINQICNTSYEVWRGENGTLSLDFNLLKAHVIVSNGQIYSSISDAVKEQRPLFILITIGIDNGVGYCTEEKFKEYYTKLISTIKDASPDTNIIIQSVLPVSKSIEKKNPPLSSSKIRQANEWINELCTKNGVRYLDTFSALSDKNGHLDPKYDSGDGITLNQMGYETMLTYIRTHGYK